MDAVAAARDLVHDRFPDARAALLAGSAVTARRTPTSDLDVLVFLDGPPAPFRETVRHAGWVAELFVQTPTAYEAFLDREIRRRRSPLLHMADEGRLIVDRDGFGARLQERAHRLVLAGPPALSAEEREDRRYAITDLLDDLSGCADSDELVVIGARLVASVAELALLDERRWIGHGKWLLRRLRAADPELAGALVDGLRAAIVEPGTRSLEVAARSVLDRAGGPLREGYHRRAPPG